MPRRRSPAREEACPHCGEPVRVGRAACRHCGSDAATGWAEAGEIEYQSVEIPEDDTDPTPEEARRRARWRIWLACGIVLVALALLRLVL